MKERIEKFITHKEEIMKELKEKQESNKLSEDEDSENISNSVGSKENFNK